MDFNGNMAGTQTLNLSAAASPVEIVDQVIRQAVVLRASDILLEPQEREVMVRLRVDGILQTFGEMPHGAYDQVINRIKVLGNMDVAESRKPQESKIRIEVEGHPYVLRAAIVSTNFGQMTALRVLDLPQFGQFSDLGMSGELTERIKKNIEGRYGLFLVCGPTGSGKTTTVHTALKHLNTGEVNIMTLEDPVEYIIPGINQIEVGSDVGLDFVSGLRMILRLNPDIVFVGEIRDVQTAQIAVQASLTGHLVISTIHGRNSVGALYRLMDLGVDKYMLNYALRAILSQRLMRRVCDHCKEVYNPTPEEMELFEKEKGGGMAQAWHGKGCEWCHNSRYRGRVGIYELLEMGDEVRKLVFAGSGETEFRRKMAEVGFEGMNKEGVRLVEGGTTSLREFLRTMYDAR
jgi:type II secretory ATPase GspE/PulE/Tfp pilus assembly ATPase PilB-like protein